VASKYRKSEYRFLLKLARDLLAARPDIQTSELAHQLGVSVRAAYNYRRAIAAGTPDPPDPVRLARELLLRHPGATTTDVAARLGLGRDMGERYYRLACEDIARNPPPSPTQPKHEYRVPRFLPKGK
jgi:hypothetical protein